MNNEGLRKWDDGLLAQVHAALVKVETLERRLGYTMDFLTPPDSKDFDHLLTHLRQRVTWLEQLSKEYSCNHASNTDN